VRFVRTAKNCDESPLFLKLLSVLILWGRRWLFSSSGVIVNGFSSLILDRVTHGRTICQKVNPRPHEFVNNQKKTYYCYWRNLQYYSIKYIDFNI
jgi:hypothetical protein